ncbi:hypothetical protein D9758_004665 [Tetrapyrgos nigripes]|uniref:Uncharacterized protein n=1 Tax=Tetrapyrgos nigripes TaxID=182062 RepID=A0A8H5H0L5_9AGAR|nr:hypothetical protein D9758_004665 [Tetrapyrgos nigripes]
MFRGGEVEAICIDGLGVSSLGLLYIFLDSHVNDFYTSISPLLPPSFRSEQTRTRVFGIVWWYALRLHTVTRWVVVVVVVLPAHDLLSFWLGWLDLELGEGLFLKISGNPSESEPEAFPSKNVGKLVYTGFRSDYFRSNPSQMNDRFPRFSRFSDDTRTNRIYSEYILFLYYPIILHVFRSASIFTGAQGQSKSSLILFARGVIARLAIWPVFRVAVQENWGGAGAAEKRTWLAGIIVDTFEQRSSPDGRYVEEMLLQVMQDEYDTNIEDGSAELVAVDIVKLWGDTCEGKQELVL